MEKEKIILVGCGQHCNVVLYNANEQGVYDIVGIVDSNSDKVGTCVHDIPILANYNDLEKLNEIKVKYRTNKFFISFGNMKYRKSCFEYFVNNGWEAVNIIHPNAIISKNAKIGKGVLIECGCLITPNPIIGDNVVVNTGSQVNHDNVICDHVYLASGVVLSGGVIIGENSLIDDGVIITLGVNVGKNCIIGAGSVVTKNIGDNIIAYGNPCKSIKNNNKY